MILALALALVASTPVGSYANPSAVTRSNDDPPIQLWVNSDNNFVRGARARVYIRSAKDGYLVVLRADAQGRVRVLFPLDPSNEDKVSGDRKLEVEGRDGSEAFTVDDGDGTGVVLAAWSETPFSFDSLVQGDQWDPQAFGSQPGGDREAALVEIVQGMAGENHFDYDVVSYTVNSVTAYNDDSNRDSLNNDGSNNNDSSNDGSNNDSPHNDGSYYGGPYYGPYFGPAYGGFGVSLGIGHGWRYGYAGFGPFCDGFYWSSWGCGPFYDPFFYPVVYRPYRYRPFVYGSFGYRVGRSGGFYRPSLIGRNRGYGFRTGTSWSTGQPRLRSPAGSGRLSSNRSFVRERTGTRSFAPGSSSLRAGGSARRSFAPGSSSIRGGGSARRSVAPSGDRSRGSAPSARSAPSDGSRRGGWGSAAPRSSGGGYSRGSGGGGGGGGGRHGGGGGGGGGRRR